MTNTGEITDSAKHTAILAQSATEALAEALMQLKNKAECAAFLADLCTPTEIKALKERWLIARLLDADSISYREISTRTGASTTTVGRVARFLQQEKHEGYRLVLDRLAKAQVQTENTP